MSLMTGVWRAVLSSQLTTVSSVSVAVNFLTSLATMDLAYRGMPFIAGHTQGTSLQPMDVAYGGMPFVIYKKAG